MAEDTYPNRRCGKCGGVAVVTKVHRTRRNIKVHHRCGGCGATFVVEPGILSISNLIAGIFVTLIGVGGIIAAHDEHPFVGPAFTLFGLWMISDPVRLHLTSRRNPPLP